LYYLLDLSGEIQDNIKVPMNIEAIISQPAEALILLQKQAEMIALLTKEIESKRNRSNG